MLNFEAIRSFLPTELRDRVILPYYMPLTTAAALASGASVQLSTPIQNVAAFQLVAIVGRVYTAGAPNVAIADPATDVTVQFSSGDNMTNGAVPWSAIVTTPGSANVGLQSLIAPRIVPGGSNITLTLANYSGVAYLYRLALVGNNVYSQTL